MVLINSINKYLLSIYYLTNTVLGAVDLVPTKPVSPSIVFSGRHNKVPETTWLKATEIHALSDSGG